jgi:hypothetical protein
MTKNEARKNGYVFQGTYAFEREKEKVLNKAAELRRAGNKAVTVLEPPDRYSNNRRTGYSVYWIESEANKTKREQAEFMAQQHSLINQMRELQTRIDAIKAKLEAMGTSKETLARWEKK